jgi:hypothetical protein
MYVEPPQEKWFLDYVIRSPRDSGVHLTAGWWAYNLVKDAGVEVRSAVEFFGGLGAQSLMIQDLFAPRNHVVRDYSHEAVAHIKAQVQGVYAHQADSYDPMWQHRADLVGLDFGDLTVWKTRKGEKHRGLLDRVFEEEPKAVVLTDVACRYLHLHRERYETLLGAGTCASYEAYLHAFAEYLRRLYGYVVMKGFWHRWSTVMVLVPKTFARYGGFVATPESPVGLRVVQ